MQAHIARQAIFDRNLRVVGYELRSGDAVETNVIVPVSAPEEAPAPAQAVAIPAPAAPVNAAPASAVVW